MNFIPLLFFFPFASGDEIVPIDSTGISYHQKMEEIVPGLRMDAADEYSFSESENDAPAIKKSGVKKVTGDDETWKFDREGNLVSHIQLNDYHRFKYGKYEEANYYKYDKQNCLVQIDNYDLSIWMSRGTYVDKTNERITYQYSSDHLHCTESGKVLNYSNIASRIVGFEPEEEYEREYILDKSGQVLNYKGWFFNHKSSVDYFYSGSDLVK